ncbi:MAG TPA: hypothetical protein VD929_05405 [Caulobacteraceae bacterium]|nr:hypothetical protein [Caulobacteraceae bacterium]
MHASTRLGKSSPRSTETRPMAAILTILAFIGALAALNLFEFGRLD